ncbi:MMPL family transporter [Streptomyces calidiresistens]|uniref:MMPL family transporter n=1 Tax=Streptomyces calidiresistens TaxID=1485586 RepID=A0A7W3T3C0_9ACTN|nr:MMPL family transporter [Streptomyces calidiresistens]MBB0230185.1 MMPL family transporter [Streptomyces calidiresistens]
MATFLYRLGRAAFRRRGRVVLIWLAVLLAIGGVASTVTGEVEEEFALPGTETQQAFELLDEAFPDSSAEAVTSRVVFGAPEGETLSDPANRAVIDEVLGMLDGADGVVDIADPFEHDTINEDETVAYATVDYNVTWADITAEMRDQLFAALDAGRDAGLVVEASGEVAYGEADFGHGEIIGIAVAAVVLLITFGSMIAAGLPLVTALLGVGIGMMGIAALSVTLGLSETTGILAMMIGLAVGIDYALFIASRYRSELTKGLEPEEAAGRAVGTAGSAVVFAGLTVIIALAGLAVVNVPILTRMGMAAAATVAVAVLVALTLVPAALGFVGKRIFGRRVRKANADRGGVPTTIPATFSRSGRENFGSRWARGVLRRPVPVLAACVALLGILALPVTDMRLGMGDEGTQPEETTQRQAYDMLSEGFGPGFNGPLLLVLDARDADDPEAAAERAADRVSELEGVVAVTPATFNEAGDIARMVAFPSSGPSDRETADLVAELRGEVAPVVAEETGAQVLVSGQTAVESDFTKVLDDALVPYLALVVGLAFVLLMLVFRSLLVPLKAALGFLLSVLAALGAVVAVFQWGWGASLLGVAETGPIVSMMPIFLIGVIFGLAMDYEVFLVTRMREAYVHGEDPQQAVVSGFDLNARVVTAAAIIMISVFFGFITAGDMMVKAIGFGLAIAILLDAFVVRMTLVPAVMGLLGRRAWWLPAWLDRILPNVDVEGASLEKHLRGSGTPTGALPPGAGGPPAPEREPEPVG